MSGIGFSEVVILCLIGLIVLGPEKLPRVANQIGGWLGQARRMTRVMKRQLEEELDLENTIKPSEPAKSDFPRKTPGPSVVQENVETESAEIDSVESKSTDSESANEHDDTYSPAHDGDELGTGVNDEELNKQKTDDVGGDVNDEAPDEQKADDIGSSGDDEIPETQESDDAQPAAVAESEASNDTKEKDS